MIPSYELFGELLAGGQPDPIHHELIKDRSSPNDWTIRLHRHQRLAQVFLFRSSGVRVRLGDLEFTTDQAMILLAPPDMPHGFQFPEDTVGDVISIRLADLPPQMQARFAQFTVQTGTFFLKGSTQNFDKIADLFTQMGQVYNRISTNRSEILTSLLDLIALYLADDLHEKNVLAYEHINDRKDKRTVQVDIFCALLEANFQNPWQVANYAKEVGVSAPHLTRLCTVILGAPPNDLVRQRRILEAKRLLEYTSLSIAEIAHRCGYRDAAFFSRSFKSATGQSPKTARKGGE